MKTFALLLILAVNGDGEAWKIDHGLTLEACAARLESARYRMETGRATIRARMVCEPETSAPGRAAWRDKGNKNPEENSAPRN